ncbi:MAG: aminotransferase class I/II-fold pyridoxal phosphate-dependent enzyme [Lactobacillaceae bacterium]|jgi:cystathionine beta-lyase|nr:aminotransferase class I/II-fold pyridoxal phosphate-dependent enzyme [Lactobacillaceae bacterium]
MDEMTKIIAATTKPDPLSGAINTPLHLSSTFNQISFDEFGEFDYARSGNPTRQVAEQAVAELENGQFGFLFSTGMAAISSVLLTFSQGDHIVVTKHVYGGTWRVFEDVLSRFGITHTFVNCADLASIEAAIQPNTKAIYLETPSNPVLAVTDIAGVVDIAKRHALITIADNTFLSPVIQKPLDLGVDIVVHSATKFLAGHSDILAGAAVTNDQALADKIYYVQNAVGATLAVFDSWLLLRGIKTLGVRMQQSANSAQQIAEWLEQQPQVTRVNYPGLPSDPGYAIQQRQAKNGGAVLSFDVGSQDHARIVAEATKIPCFSVSLGGVETILSYPPKMSHAELDGEGLAEAGITPGLLRFSVGLEDPQDLINDLAQAFAQFA